MKKCILMTTAMLMIAGLSFAQQRGRSTPEERAKGMSERLEKALQLSAAQKDSVYAYSLAQSKAMRQAFQNNRNGDRQQMGEKRRELRKETDTKILSILDSDQKKAYTKLMEERANRMRQGGGRRSGGSNR